MKKPALAAAIALGLLGAVIVFTPIGRAVLDLGSFFVESGWYLSKERALAKEMRGWPASKFEELAGICARLASTQTPGGKEARRADGPRDGVPIPTELAHLNPRRVWIEFDSVEIELMHMMDSDVTLTISPNDGVWMVTGHFGDYVNKPELLFPKQESNKALQPTPVNRRG